MKNKIEFKNITPYNLLRVVNVSIKKAIKLNKSIDRLVEYRDNLKIIKDDNKFIKEKLKKVKSRQAIKKYENQLKSNNIFIKDIFKDLNQSNLLNIKTRSNNTIFSYNKYSIDNTPNSFYKENNSIEMMLNIVNDIELLQDLDKNTPTLRARLEELILQNYDNIDSFKKELNDYIDFYKKPSFSSINNFKIRIFKKKKLSVKKIRRKKNKLARKARRKNRRKK